MTPKEILDLPMKANDANAKTIRGYFHALARAVWKQQEGFSGKRPFGNSGWQWDLFAPLIKAGLIKGELDEDGFIMECDDRAGDKLIRQAIEALFEEPSHA